MAPRDRGSPSAARHLARAFLPALAAAALASAAPRAAAQTFRFTGEDVAGDVVLGAGEVLQGSAHVEGALVALPGAVLAPDGWLSASEGIELDPGALLVGHGIVSSELVNHGLVLGGDAGAGAALELAGDVSGAGVFGGDVVVSGTLRPGNSPACVPFENLILAPSATLVIEIGGTNPCAEYDRLEASGSVSIDGGLTVQLIDGFVPALGDSFVFVTAPSLSGAFQFIRLSLPTLPAGRAWSLGVTPTEAKLTVVAASGCGLLGIEPLLLLALTRVFAARRRAR